MLLGSVLFLTGVWHETVLRAGLQIAPGPGDGRAVRGAGGHASRSAYRPARGRRSPARCCSPPAASGGSRTSAPTPNYAADFLPDGDRRRRRRARQSRRWPARRRRTLPPARFATGSAELTMSRQIGAALGVALLVAVLGTPSPADAVDAFQDGLA